MGYKYTFPKWSFLVAKLLTQQYSTSHFSHREAQPVVAGKNLDETSGRIFPAPHQLNDPRHLMVLPSFSEGHRPHCASFDSRTSGDVQGDDKALCSL